MQVLLLAVSEHNLDLGLEVEVRHLLAINYLSTIVFSNRPMLESPLFLPQIRPPLAQAQA